MLALILLASAAAADPGRQVVPIDLPTMTAREARQLHGQFLIVAFEVGSPPLTYAEQDTTTVGTEDQSDGIERTAYLTPSDLDVVQGQAVRVFGRLRLVQHPEDAVLGVPAWTEIRLEDAVVVK